MAFSAAKKVAIPDSTFWQTKRLLSALSGGWEALYGWARRIAVRTIDTTVPVFRSKHGHAVRTFPEELASLDRHFLRRTTSTVGAEDGRFKYQFRHHLS